MLIAIIVLICILPPLLFLIHYLLQNKGYFPFRKMNKKEEYKFYDKNLRNK